MVQLYMGYDINGGGGLGITNPGGGYIDFFEDAAAVSKSTSSEYVKVNSDFSNGIIYNPVTKQWVGAVSGDGIYIYNSQKEMASNTYTKKIPYAQGHVNFNNGILYKADTDTYIGAYHQNGVQTVLEFDSLEDMAIGTNPVNTYTGVGNYNNGIEYSSAAGEWYAAWNGAGTNRNGEVFIFSSFEDFLAKKPKTTYTYFGRGADYEMGLATVPCFARGTLIETETGPVTIECLACGDMVTTLDDGNQPIRWIGSRRLDAEDLARGPALLPIRIAAGSLGADVPTKDLILSQQHRVLVRSKISHRMFGTDEVLVAAKLLLELDGVDIVDDIEQVEYFHFLFDRHQVVFSNGAATESLYTGVQALNAVGAAARKEIFQLLPELASHGSDCLPEAARKVIVGRHGRRLVTRHIRNGQNIIGA